MSLASGTKLGPYEIQSLLGAGGMGEVYRARDTRLERTVAVKILTSNFSTDAERLRRFEQEARAAAALNHPNILAIFDIGTENGSPYIVSELLEGDTLRERMRDGVLPLRKAIDYGSQVARGLAAAHDKGIVHRDLKPENVFVTKDGHVKILDFGLAKLAPSVTAPELTNAPTMGSGAVDQHTTPGVVLGTVGYMSPEQVRGLPSDQRSDIFSLGAILFEALSGKRAFKGDTSADTMSAILREEPQELSDLNRAVPPAIDRIVRHCLEKNPTDRFESARDVAFGLEELSTVSSSAGTDSAAEAARGRGLRTPLLVAIPALVLVAAAAFWGGRATVPVSNPVFTRLTFRGGYVASARFASDGQTVVYSAGFGGDPLEIYTTRAGATQSRELGFKNSSILGISRNDEMAITLDHDSFVANASSGTLARVPFTGGAPREVAEKVLCADWSPDGETLALARRVGDSVTIEYPPGKVLYKSSGWVSDVRVSPDGNTVAFIDHPVVYDSFGSIAMVDRAGKKTTLSGEFSSALGLAWLPSGKEIWYTASKVHISSNVFATTLSGRQRLVWAGAGSLVLRDISSDGRVLFVRENRRRGISGLFPGHTSETDLSWQDWSLPTYVSPDGRWIYFSEQGDSAGAKYSAYMRATDGSPAIRLGDGTPWSVSPDGKWVASLIPGEPQQLVLLPTRSGEAVNPSQSGFNYDRAEWLPDGRRLLIDGSEPGKPTRAYLLNAAGGQLQAITPENQAGLLSPDGQSVIVPAGNKVISYPFDGGQPREAKNTLPADMLFLTFRFAGRYLYGSLRQEVPLKVFRFDITTGQKQLWKELAPGERAGVYNIGILSVTPDARWYAYSYVRDLSDLYIVEGLK
jgi:eukaryotic-like serine/threonine-protein kinase